MAKKLKHEEVPVAYYMFKAGCEETKNSFDGLAFRFLCFWTAFNNIYTYKYMYKPNQTGRQSDQGLKREVKWEGNIPIPKASHISEKEMLDHLFKECISEELKKKLVKSEYLEYFVERTPSRRGKPIKQFTYQEKDYPLNGVINVGYTRSKDWPVWSPIDIGKYKKKEENINFLAKQVYELIYVVRNNLFHGSKAPIDNPNNKTDSRDSEVLTNALPLLRMIVEEFLEC